MSVPARALQFQPGRRYTIHLKDGQAVTGRCSMAGLDSVMLVHPAGFFTVRFVGIKWIDNLDAR